ncbi:YbfA family protein [Pantoea sp. 1.19]|uniref:YbfA family protein n=1 Tax=Pantoea sp. 1.19 TaxID=1925589 RepID=UPI000948E582|nr:YbfA family protein [Pantoea sp. 1.19]
MAIYNAYPWHKIFLRRAAALTVGLLALPVMLFRRDRARFYSYLHRVWSKTSSQPVWQAQAEAAGSYLY